MKKCNSILIIWLVFANLVIEKIISSSLALGDGFSIELENDSEETDSEEEKELEKNYFFDVLFENNVPLSELIQQNRSFKHPTNPILEGYTSSLNRPPQQIS